MDAATVRNLLDGSSAYLSAFDIADAITQQNLLAGAALDRLVRPHHSPHTPLPLPHEALLPLF